MRTFMKFLQIKYLTFYLVFLIISVSIGITIQYRHKDIFPVYYYATPGILVYLLIAITYYFLKKRKNQPVYIDMAINFGVLILVAFTLYIFVLDYRHLMGLFFGNWKSVSQTIYIVNIFVFSYQFLVVVYAIVTDILRSFKNTKKEPFG